VSNEQTRDPNLLAMEAQLLAQGMPYAKRKVLLKAASSKNGHNEGKPKTGKKCKPSGKRNQSKHRGKQSPEHARTDPGQTETKPTPDTAQMPSREEFHRLARAADRGDKQAKLQLGKTLDANAEIWRTAGDLGAHAELSLIRAIAKGNGLEMGMFKRYTDDLIEQVSAPDPSPLEKLAARRVIQCWLWCQYVDMIVAGNNDMPLNEMKFWAGRQDAAHRRWVSAMKMLTAIRALLPGQSVGSAPVRKLTADAAPPTETPTFEKIEKETDAEPATKPINRINGNGRSVAGTLIPRPRRRSATPSGAT